MCVLCSTHFLQCTQLVEFARDAYSDTGTMLLDSIAIIHPFVISISMMWHIFLVLYSNITDSSQDQVCDINKTKQRLEGMCILHVVSGAFEILSFCEVCL